MPPLLFAELPFPGWDPVALRLGPLAVRWYGLGYLAAFLIAGWVLDRLGRGGFVRLDRNAVSDLIGWLVGGVLIGARLGYAAIYEPGLLLHPLELVQVWRGGLSFHGGLVGVIAASAWFAWRRGIAWRRLTDALALAVPPGIFLVRCANFVNGELYGRLAPGLPWGVRFPTDPLARRLAPELGRAGALRWHEPWEQLVADGRWPAIHAQLPLRHPSQLYEALLEGVVIGGAVWAAWRWSARARERPGAFAALFLGLYALARFAVEFTREPDVQLGLVLGPLSMGQVLSLGVAAGAAILFWWPRRVRDTLSALPGQGL